MKKQDQKGHLLYKKDPQRQGELLSEQKKVNDGMLKNSKPNLRKS